MTWLKVTLILIVLFSITAIQVEAQSASGTATASALFTKEVKSLEIVRNFTADYSANTNISGLFFINKTDFPDGVDRFISVAGILVFDKTGANPQQFTILVNGTNCENSPYTTSQGQTQYVANFICTEQFTETFDTVYNLTFSSTQNSENLFFKIMMTYVNDPDFADLEDHLGTVDLIFAKVHEDNILKNDDFCSSANTSRKQLTLFTETTSDNETSNTTSLKLIDTFCDLGCNNQTGFCNQPESQITFFYVLVIFVIFGIFLLLMRGKSR